MYVISVAYECYLMWIWLVWELVGISFVWPLHWRHNGRDSVSNHQPHDCLLNRLFRRRSKKTSKLRVTGLCAGNSRTNGQLRGKCFHLMTSSWMSLFLIMLNRNGDIQLPCGVLKSKFFIGDLTPCIFWRSLFCPVDTCTCKLANGL